MASFKEEIDDLKYFCSKDYRNSGDQEKKNSNMYRLLMVAWILMLVNIIPLILTWTVFAARVPGGIRLIYTIVSIVFLVIGIAAWFIVTKEN